MKIFLITTVLAAIFIGACTADSPQGVPQTNTPASKNETTLLDTPTLPLATPTSGRILTPYPYTTPVPPPTPTILDGIYTRPVNFEGTPTPCRRCAPYRAEGGTWTLILDAGAFRVSHSATDFQGIGSFTVSNNELALFNDPNCHEYVGKYNWTQDSESLVLTATADECAFGLRAKNLAAGVWHKQPANVDKCQPPSVEAAVTGHWPAPNGCQ